jgi:cytoskeleton protein RodZ
MGKESALLNDDPGEWEFPSGRDLGALLRSRREEVGLTYAEISEQIKVKAGYLEALENEDWDALPSPAFIKGFLRSYGRRLGLSEDSLVALYQENAPPPQPLPRPIQAPDRESRLSLYLVLVFVLLAVGAAGYYWIAPLVMGPTPTEKEAVRPAEEEPDTRPAAAREEQRPDVKERPPEGKPQPSDALDHAPVTAQDGPIQAPEAPGSDTKPDQVLQGHEETIPPPEINGETASAPAPDAVQAPGSEGLPLVLKADVRERTWVRVTVDDQRPKEYTFEPESSPEWRAREGFELVIGNAGSISLEFNGERLEDLGRPGQVIKLRLPGDEERSVSTE